MPARSPEDCDRLFAKHANAGDLDALVALYEHEATFVTRDRRIVKGQAAIRDELAGLLAMNPRMRMKVTEVVPAGGDLAVLYNDWSMRADGPDGERIDATGRAFELVRCQTDGTWLFVVDEPFARA